MAPAGADSCWVSSSFLLSHFHPLLWKQTVLPNYKQQNPGPTSLFRYRPGVFALLLLERVSCALGPFSLSPRARARIPSSQPCCCCSCSCHVPVASCGSGHRHLCSAPSSVCLCLPSSPLTTPNSLLISTVCCLGPLPGPPHPTSDPSSLSDLLQAVALKHIIC